MSSVTRCHSVTHSNAVPYGKRLLWFPIELFKLHSQLQFHTLQLRRFFFFSCLRTARWNRTKKRLLVSLHARSTKDSSQNQRYAFSSIRILCQLFCRPFKWIFLVPRKIWEIEWNIFVRFLYSVSLGDHLHLLLLFTSA